MKEEISKDLEILIPNFLRNRKEEAENLKNLIENRDYEEAGKLSHSLKGVLGSYGFKEGYLITAGIDKKIKNRDISNLDEDAEIFRDYMNNVEIKFVDEEL